MESGARAPLAGTPAAPCFHPDHFHGSAIKAILGRSARYPYAHAASAVPSMGAAQGKAYQESGNHCVRGWYEGSSGRVAVSGVLGYIPVCLGSS